MKAKSADSEKGSTDAAPKQDASAAESKAQAVVTEPEQVVSAPTIAEPPSQPEKATTAPNENELADLRKENEGLRLEITHLNRRNSSLATDSGLLNEARQLATRLEEEKSQLESRVESLVNLEAEVDRIREDREQYERKARDLEADLKRHQDQAEKLRSELEQEKSRADSIAEEAEQKAKEFESRSERQRDREGSLEAELTKLKQVSSCAGIQLDMTEASDLSPSSSSCKAKQIPPPRKLKRRGIHFVGSTMSYPQMSSSGTLIKPTCRQSTSPCKRSWPRPEPN